MSKILNFEQVGTVYEEIVSKAISSKEPKRVFCAFILYSTIGIYFIILLKIIIIKASIN